LVSGDPDISAGIHACKLATREITGICRQAAPIVDSPPVAAAPALLYPTLCGSEPSTVLLQYLMAFETVYAWLDDATAANRIASARGTLLRVLILSP
jgi:hypothetical protein